MYCDVDIQFFTRSKGIICDNLEGYDIVCQRDDPFGSLCTGFFAVRCNEKTLKLWEKVRDHVEKERRDQPAFNRIIRETNDIRFTCFPNSFFGAGTFKAKLWSPGNGILISTQPIMHHANWTIGLENKLSQLETVREIVQKGKLSIQLNNAKYYLRKPWRLCR